MIILEDTRQQAEKHKLKHLWFERNGIEVRRTKLYVGDYTLPTNQSVCVDSKFSISELMSDVCGKQHERFRNELLRSQESGIQLYVLVENEEIEIRRSRGITSPYIDKLDNLSKYVNPRLFIYQGGKQKYPKATRGVTLMKACKTLETKYGVKFVFCRPQDAGAKIVELLGGIEK